MANTSVRQTRQSDRKADSQAVTADIQNNHTKRRPGSQTGRERHKHHQKTKIQSYSQAARTNIQTDRKSIHTKIQTYCQSDKQTDSQTEHTVS